MWSMIAWYLYEKIKHTYQCKKAKNTCKLNLTVYLNNTMTK